MKRNKKRDWKRDQNRNWERDLNRTKTEIRSSKGIEQEHEVKEENITRTKKKI